VRGEPASEILRFFHNGQPNPKGLGSLVNTEMNQFQDPTELINKLTLSEQTTRQKLKFETHTMIGVYQDGPVNSRQQLTY
jgi:hypothetical protein